MQAAKVGQMLIELKEVTAHGEWAAKLAHALNLTPAGANTSGSRLMKLARNLPLLEQHRPDSQRAGVLKNLTVVFFRGRPSIFSIFFADRPGRF